MDFLITLSVKPMISSKKNTLIKHLLRRDLPRQIMIQLCLWKMKTTRMLMGKGRCVKLTYRYNQCVIYLGKRYYLIR